MALVHWLEAAAARFDRNKFYLTKGELDDYVILVSGSF